MVREFFTRSLVKVSLVTVINGQINVDDQIRVVGYQADEPDHREDLRMGRFIHLYLVVF